MRAPCPLPPVRAPGCDVGPPPSQRRGPPQVPLRSTRAGLRPGPLVPWASVRKSCAPALPEAPEDYSCQPLYSGRAKALGGHRGQGPLVCLLFSRFPSVPEVDPQ